MRRFTDKLRFTTGGKRRQDSVFAGLSLCSSGMVMVHDAARPFVSTQLIDRCCQMLREEKAFIAAIPVVDTIKKTSQRQITATIDRNSLYRAQTPQGAPRDILLKAFTDFGSEDITDESALLERAGVPVEIVDGQEANFKITRREDLELAEPLFQKHPIHAMNQTSQNLFPQRRVGHGFDAHRLVSERELVLGGLTIPYEKGLAGHSDADVLTHAVCDALLGAAGLGDIGKAFPDSSEEFKDIYSIELLRRVMATISADWRIENIDVTLICQAPKIAPFIEEMKQKLIVLPKAFSSFEPLSAINIKATTEEKMGYTGRGEGISCHAVVMLISA